MSHITLKGLMGYIDDKTANNVAYDNTATGLGTGDVQSALDNVASVVATGPAGLSISSNVTTSNNSTTFTLMSGMTLTPTKGGNYAVIFTAQFQTVSDTTITVYANNVQVVSSVRTGNGPAGNHNFILTTSEKVTILANQNIQIFWSSAGSSTCLGRNMTAIKVT